MLRSRTNSKLVTTPSNGASPLIPSVTADQGGNGEQFDMLDLGQGLVALRAHANLKYVNAASATSPLIADSTSIATSNQFYYYHYGDGSVLFQSAKSPYYLVQAPNNGTSPLNANVKPDQRPHPRHPLRLRPDQGRLNQTTPAPWPPRPTSLRPPIPPARFTDAGLGRLRAADRYGTDRSRTADAEVEEAALIRSPGML